MQIGMRMFQKRHKIYTIRLLKKKKKKVYISQRIGPGQRSEIIGGKLP